MTLTKHHQTWPRLPTYVLMGFAFQFARMIYWFQVMALISLIAVIIHRGIIHLPQCAGNPVHNHHRQLIIYNKIVLIR